MTFKKNYSKSYNLK